MPESIRSKDVQKKAALIGRLYNSNIVDLSDMEIERCLRNTCSPTKLIAIAKRLRDSGILTIDEIYALDSAARTCHTQPNENAMPWRAGCLEWKRLDMEMLAASWKEMNWLVWR